MSGWNVYPFQNLLLSCEVLGCGMVVMAYDAMWFGRWMPTSSEGGSGRFLWNVGYQ